MKEKSINKILIEAQNQIDMFNKEKFNNDQKIKELEEINDELNKKCKKQMKIVKKLTAKLKKLSEEESRFLRSRTSNEPETSL